MRAVVQRASSASVEIEGSVSGSIDRGLVVYVGVGRDDGPEDARWLADKVANLRIFMDGDGKMNRSLVEEGGGALVVSQFTLYADARKGRRPSYSDAAEPASAVPLYELFVELLRGQVGRVETGRFQAVMRVGYVNEGPITILLDSKKGF